MQANPPEKVTRRIAVILGPGRSSRNLLDMAAPLLGKDRAMEMQGLFVEEAELRHAAALPFVKELCRVTFSVREFNSDQFEQALALRMRTAQRALGLLARRAGVSHSFRNVRGSADLLLREAVNQSDITIFEPAGMLAAAMGPGARSGSRSGRIVVYVGDLETVAGPLVAASQLAQGDMRRISVLTSRRTADERLELEKLLRSLLPSRPGRMQVLADPDAESLITSIRAENPGMLVLAATSAMLRAEFLADLSKRLRCPICLVRFWGN